MNLLKNINIQLAAGADVDLTQIVPRRSSLGRETNFTLSDGQKIWKPFPFDLSLGHFLDLSNLWYLIWKRRLGAIGWYKNMEYFPTDSVRIMEKLILHKPARSVQKWFWGNLNNFKWVAGIKNSFYTDMWRTCGYVV